MIKVKVKKNHIEINGHAMYDDYGKDIVCASVSSIVTTSINAILKFDQDGIKYEVKDGHINIEIQKEKKEIKIIIDNMLEMLDDLQKQYKKNIQIYKEVQ